MVLFNRICAAFIFNTTMSFYDLFIPKINIFDHKKHGNVADAKGCVAAKNVME